MKVTFNMATIPDRLDIACKAVQSVYNQADEVSFRSLSKILLLISKRYYSPRGKNISNLITQIKSKKFTKATLGRCCIEKINETLVVSTENL